MQNIAHLNSNGLSKSTGSGCMGGDHGAMIEGFEVVEIEMTTTEPGLLVFDQAVDHDRGSIAIAATGVHGFGVAPAKPDPGSRWIARSGSAIVPCRRLYPVGPR